MTWVLHNYYVPVVFDCNCTCRINTYLNLNKQTQKFYPLLLLLFRFFFVTTQKKSLTLFWCCLDSHDEVKEHQKVLKHKFNVSYFYEWIVCVVVPRHFYKKKTTKMVKLCFVLVLLGKWLILHAQATLIEFHNFCINVISFFVNVVVYKIMVRFKEVIVLCFETFFFLIIFLSILNAQKNMSCIFKHFV